MLNLLIGIVPLLLILSIIVTIHELGHFGVARLFKTRVERFSVGFGKILLRKRDKNGVEWCLSAIPMGGYVKFAGDANVTSMMPGPDELEASRKHITATEGAQAVSEYFHFKPLWQRFLIVLAGPMANFILAITVFALIFMIHGYRTAAPVIGIIEPESPAAAAGFVVNDRIIAINGTATDDWSDVVRSIVLSADTPITFSVNRAGQPVDIVATPRRQRLNTGNPDQNVRAGYMGIAPTGEMVIDRINPAEAIGLGAVQTWKVLETSLTYVGRIFTGKENGSMLSGPIGMTQAAGDLTAEVARANVPLPDMLYALTLRYMSLIAGISVAVGFINLLPIPMLDGGHLLFYAYQAVTRKTISATVQNAAARVAIVFVLGLMLFAAWNDINHNTGIARFIGGLFS